ncbi:MAG TPA: glycosyltransferase [Thermoanaerobaculia bacterium]|jgi:glycosyltransferase involved in cell wall biosynthesis
MRSVLYLAPFDPTVAGSGSSARGRLVLDALSRRYETHVVHLKSRHGGERDEALAGRLASLTAVDYSNAGYFLWSPALLRAAADVLQRHRIDFLFAEFEKAGGYAWRLSRRFGKPFFYASHNVEFRRSLDLARGAPLRLAFVPWLYLLERQACRHAFATFAISERDARVFRRWAPEGRVSVLPLAFDDEVFHPFYEGAASDPPVVLMVGNFGYAASREAARLVRDRILPAVVARHPRAIFRFVGGGLPGDIRHPNVEAPGLVEALATEYRRATVVIAPIASGGGIKVKVIEALAMGRFLVATPKAMEGIDIKGLTHLTVSSLDRFAEEVARALDRRLGRSEANWETISRRFGARHQGAVLLEKIESALSELGGRGPAALTGHGNCSRKSYRP